MQIYIIYNKERQLTLLPAADCKIYKCTVKPADIGHTKGKQYSRWHLFTCVFALCIKGFPRYAQVDLNSEVVASTGLTVYFIHVQSQYIQKQYSFFFDTVELCESGLINTF